MTTKEQVLEALDRAGSVKAAAALLGVSRQTMYEYLRRFEIEVNRRTTANVEADPALD